MAVNFSTLITGLGDLGTDLGAFMTNIAPGILTFAITLGIGGAIIGIIYGVATLVKRKIK